jgi:thiamine pyrophosphokinase
MRAVIFVNGIITNYASTTAWLRADDLLICANGGTRHCLALGRVPHALVGDLDSIDAVTAQQLAGQGVIFERHPRAKDETDLELAVAYAVRQGVQRVLLLGALGGRLDQMVANLLMMARTDWPVRMMLADEQQLAQVVAAGEQLTLEAPMGSTVSVIPLTATVTGITYTGLEYPLTNHTLLLGSTRGVSNVIIGSPATIQVASGLLLVVQTFAV